MKNLRLLLLKTKLSGGFILCCLIFCLLLLSTILIHQSVLRYFISSKVDARTRNRVLPGGYIIIQSQLILLQYHHTFSFHFLNRDDGLFPQSVIYCSSKDNNTWWLLTILCLEDNHRIIGTGFLYLNRCNCAAWYLIDLFRLGNRTYVDGGRTCLGICG